MATAKTAQRVIFGKYSFFTKYHNTNTTCRLHNRQMINSTYNELLVADLTIAKINVIRTFNIMKPSVINNAILTRGVSVLS